MTGDRLIGLDWGSSSLRAYRIGDGGCVLDQRANDSGASRIVGDAALFEARLRELIGDWLHDRPALPVVACGMVGSAHGWREAPYAMCPVDVSRLHAQAVTVPGHDGLRVHIVPGVAQRPAGGLPDVMRGEETQLAGLLAREPALARDALVLLPGTHSKWVTVRSGRIVGFTTRMTGELFALLRTHSVLGRLIEASASFRSEAFDRGVQLGRQDQGADLAGRLFSVRSLGLFDEMPHAALGDYLSGLMIGSEIAAALAHDAGGAPLALVGESALCDRYRQALRACGREPTCVHGNTAAIGLWQLAERAGWTA